MIQDNGEAWQRYTTVLDGAEYANQPAKHDHLRIHPEYAALGDWQTRVIESLAAAITLHVREHNSVPSPEEYRRMAYNALVITR